MGQWTQNEQAFIPFTTNTAITLPDGRDATSLELAARPQPGRQDRRLRPERVLHHRASGDNLRLNARYRLYKNDNKTPRIRFEEGYVRFDAVWEEIPRITVPNGFDSNYLDVYATFDLGSALGLEAGWKYNKISRTYRETEHTTENTFRVAADVRPGGGFTARGIYEHGKRDFDSYNPVEAEEHSFLEAGPPANQTVLRRFDQAKRDRDRVGRPGPAQPGRGTFNDRRVLLLEQGQVRRLAGVVQRRLPRRQRGRLRHVLLRRHVGPARPDGGEVHDVQRRRRLLARATRSRSTPSTAARTSSTTRPAGRAAGRITFNPAWNWSSQVDDKVDSFGAGADFTLVPDKWFLNLFYRYQKVDGNNAFTAGASARPPTTGPVENIASYDDTEINHLSGRLKWQFNSAWAVALGGWWEKYVYTDDQTGQTLYYMPASFFLNPVNGSYDGWTSYANLTYKF